MLEITKIIEWDMGHRIPAHQSKCQNPHGHRYRLEATLSGKVCREVGSPNEGMVLDFGDLRGVLEKQIYQRLDHCFVYSSQDSLMRDFFRGPGKELRSVETNFIPTAEEIVRWCASLIEPELPERVKLSRLRLYETPSSWADWSPDEG